MDIEQIRKNITINFPCPNYVIKIIGDNCTDLVPSSLKIIKSHAEDFDESDFTLRSSKKGNFVTLQVKITAQNIKQLKDINADLIATKIVHMVL